MNGTILREICNFVIKFAKLLALGIKKRMNSFCSALVFSYLCPQNKIK